MKKQIIISIPALFLTLILFQNCDSTSFEANEIRSLTQSSASENPISGSINEADLPSTAPEAAEPGKTNTNNPVATNPLIITKLPSSKDATANSVTIEWETSENSTGVIEYGVNDSLGTKNTAENSYRFSKHSQKIKNLKANTTYYFKVESKNQSGEMVTSKVYQFDTLEASTQNVPQTISGVGATRPLADIPASPINPNAYYVATNGNDKNDGRSPAKPLKTIQVGINKLTAGQTLYVKAGNYGNQKISTNLKGTSSKPISIEGYRKTPGDNPTIKGFNHNSSHDPNVMPLLNGKTRLGIGTILRGSYFTFKNFQITNFKAGVLATNIDRSVIENVIVSEMGVRSDHYSGLGIVLTSAKNSTLRNSVVVNATAEAISLRTGTNNVLEGNSVFCDDNSVKTQEEGAYIPSTSATDYYFILTNSTGNKVRNNYIERVGDINHPGHGFSVKNFNENNIFENNTAVNFENGGLVIRWRKAQKNIFRKNHVKGATCILSRDGASLNIFEDSLLEDCSNAFSFVDSHEDQKKQWAASDNLYRNIQVKNAKRVFYFHWYSYRDAVTLDNVFDNIQVDGAKTLILGEHFSKNNVVKNSRFSNVENYLEVKGDRKPADIDIKFVNSQCVNCGFKLPNQ